MNLLGLCSDATRPSHGPKTARRPVARERKDASLLRCILYDKKEVGKQSFKLRKSGKAKTIYVHNNTSNDLEQRGGLGKW